ncbi:MAG: hypothetical protein ACN6NT_06790 [Comamonas sp.]
MFFRLFRGFRQGLACSHPQLPLAEKAVFSVIHIKINSKKSFVCLIFVAKTELHQSAYALVDRKHGKHEISTKIQIFWKLSMKARQQQHGLAHIFLIQTSA